MRKAKRIWLGKNSALPQAEDLITVQKESWNNFLKHDLAEIFQAISPINDYTGNNWSLELGEISLGEPLVTPLKAKLKGMTYSIPLRINARLENKRTGQVVEEEIFVANIPNMTSEGTFIIGGIERGVNNQLVRSPGVYFVSEDDPSTGKTLFKAEIRPLRGSWLEFFIGRHDVIYARIDRRRKFPATILLRALGISSDKELLKRFSDFLAPTIGIDPSKTKEEALLEFYRKLRPGEPPVLENAISLFNSSFFDIKTYEIGKAGRYKINRRLGLDFDDQDPQNWVLKPEDIIESVKYLIKLQKREETKLDDIDHLANRRLRRVGEILAQSVLKRAMARLEATNVLPSWG